MKTAEFEGLSFFALFLFCVLRRRRLSSAQQGVCSVQVIHHKVSVCGCWFLAFVVKEKNILLNCLISFNNLKSRNNIEIMFKTFLKALPKCTSSTAVFATSGVALCSMNDSDESNTMYIENKVYRVGGNIVSKEEKEENDLRWEEKAKSCPLCRLFLDSPCAEEFKTFSDCADRAKEIGEEVPTLCGEKEFAIMRQCMQLYPDHFEILMEAEEGIVADDDDDKDGDSEDK